MNEAMFYTCIDAAWTESKGDWSLHHQLIQQHLTGWALPDLVEFHVTQQHLKRAAFTPLIFNAAFMIWDGALGMDGFLDFADILSVTPQQVFKAIILDPDHLIEVPTLWSPSEESFWLIPFNVFDAQRRVESGTHLLDDYLPPNNQPHDLWTRLKGHPNRTTAQQLLPKLYARFGELAFNGR